MVNHKYSTIALIAIISLIIFGAVAGDWQDIISQAKNGSTCKWNNATEMLNCTYDASTSGNLSSTQCVLFINESYKICLENL